MKNGLGSSFDEFLEEEGMLAQSEAVAAKRVIAYQIEEAMRKAKITKTEMAKRMHTSRAAVNRLLDPMNTSVNLSTIESAAVALGRRIRIEMA
ncbi:helix-turn-helix domain-containing protein [Desulfatirhabdium butyrativorans]|uniref:helix-turn-helix domain-containing protein n=1 Tax=Desulfatirhabdium butyrativorans TaxID=340467 RepID=UPI00041F34E3|nr:helix-turn-helix transcriptional regulator [Desulfatirhabdium butyrativorans]